MGRKKTAAQKKKKRKKAQARKAQAPTPEPTEEAQNIIKQAQIWLNALSTEDVITADLFSETGVAEAKKTFDNNAPFKYHIVPNFMEDAFCGRLREELETLDYNRKSNDLYQFVQSDDLKGVTLPLISKMKEVFYSEKFRNALREITGIEVTGLSSAVDLFAAVYQQGDRLLCHDDKLPGRRIAFIYYLVPEDWSAADGGCLDLYSADALHEPTTVAKSLVPRWNSFIFFEVSPTSHHAVAEVLAANKNRISVGGWFHGAPLKRAPGRTEKLPTFAPPKPLELKGGIGDWVARDYRKKGTVKRVLAQFAEESSIELQNFLRADKYAELCEALAGEARWTEVGPPNKRSYRRLAVPPATAGDEEGPVVQLHRFLGSELFAKYLFQLTGLTVTKTHCEARNFSTGSYTLAHDQDPENKERGLDVVLCCVPTTTTWQPEHGGSLHYLAEGEDEELLTVTPRSNTLSMVFRADGGVLRFVNYVTARAKAPRHDYSCVFRVEAIDSDDEEELAL